MVGPPGTGKSMLASCLPGILPPMAAQEMLENAMIRSVSGMMQQGRLDATRPYRAPHHSASLPALVGGGHRIKPGEISLAHHGVLFMDEFPEFSRGALEALRQPLETGDVTISRANQHATFPARFQLVAAMNPCRCGYLGDEKRSCSRAPRCGADYQNRLSGPLLDRFDLRIEVPPVPAHHLAHLPTGETSASVAARIARARQAQLDRQGCINAHITAEQIDKDLRILPEAQQILLTASERLSLSMRALGRLQKVARTIADLGAAADVTEDEMIEALGYRQNL